MNTKFESYKQSTPNLCFVFQVAKQPSSESISGHFRVAFPKELVSVFEEKLAPHIPVSRTIYLARTGNSHVK